MAHGAPGVDTNYDHLMDKALAITVDQRNELYAANKRLRTQNAALLEALKAAENAMDKVNGSTGTKSCPCCFCLAEVYNGEVGIVHADNCPVIQARAAIAAAELPAA